jgi:gluconolactonase
VIFPVVHRKAVGSGALLLFSACLLGCIFVSGQEGASLPEKQAAPAETSSPDIPGVIAAGTKVQLMKQGLQGAQGATATPDGSLLFTERTPNKIWKLDNDANFSSYMEDTNATNSFLFDPKGRAIGVERMPQQVALLAPSKDVLADKFEGHPFGNLNDLAIDQKGGVYFTDDHGIPADGIKPALYYLNPNGQVKKIAEDFAFPNGVVLSPDEKTLYVDDTQGDSIRVFDIKPDGSAVNERTFVTITEGLRKSDTGVMASGADGLTIDAAGRLYVAANSGVQVYSPQGNHLGTIPIPKRPAQLAFAGLGKKTLFVLAGDSLFKIPMLAEGYEGRLK